MKRIACIFFFIIILLCMSSAAIAADNIYTASVEGEVSLYISPSIESYEIMKLPSCVEINVLEKRQTWGLIEYDNKTGWINMSYTRQGYMKAAEATGMDSEKLIKVSSPSGSTALSSAPYSNPFDEGKNSQRIPNETVLSITRETSAGWGLVSIHNEYKWINLAETVEYIDDINVKQYELYSVYVLSPDGRGVIMWETAKADKECAVIPDCTQLTAREKSGEYIYVSYAGMNGWIKGEYTESSLFNAQVQAGNEVNKSYRIDSGAYGNKVDLLSVPSYKDEDGAVVLCSVKNNAEVFVLRSIWGDWNLIQYNGYLGWIPPGSLGEAMTDDRGEGITVFETPEEGYISTTEGNGLRIFAKASEEKGTVYLPETTKITVVAEKGDYKYIVCDYASGWAKNVSVTDSFEKSITRNIDKSGKTYTIKKETFLMSMPSNEKKLGSAELCSIKLGEEVKPLRYVKTGEDNWALIEYEGQIGWINISDDSKNGFPFMGVLAIMLVIAVAALAIVVIIMKKKRKKSFGKIIKDEKMSEPDNTVEDKKSEKKEVEENEKDVSDGDSRVEEKSADVPGK